MSKRFSKLIKLLKSSDQYTTLPLISAVISSIVMLVLFLLTYNNLPDKLPLFYSLTWGSSQLVQKNQFLFMPIIVIFIALVNLSISSQLHSSQLVLKRILLSSIALISLILLVSAINIIFIFL